MVDEQSLSEPAVGTPIARGRARPRGRPGADRPRQRPCVVLSGSGDGLVDAAAAGLIDGDEAIRYSASMSGDELAARRRRRRRGHRHRLQPATSPPLAQLAGRHRLHRVGIGRPDRVGRLRRRPARRVPRAPTRPPTRCRCRTARCRCGRRSYGERFSYQPEARPALAIDGDPNTAWTVLDPHGPVPRGHDDDRGRPRHAAAAQRARRRPPPRHRHRHRRRRRAAAGRARRPLARHRPAHRLPGDRRADDDPHRPRRRVVGAPATAIRPDAVGFAEIDVGLGARPRGDRRAHRPHDGDARRRDRASGHVRPDSGAGSPDEPLAVRSRVAHRPPARRAVRPGRRRRGHRARSTGGPRTPCSPSCSASPGRPPTARLDRCAGGGRLGGGRRRRRDGVDHAVQRGRRRRPPRRARRPGRAADAAPAPPATTRWSPPCG